MSRGLAIETSGRVGSLASSLNGVTLREIQFEHGLQHAAKLVVLVDELMREQSWKPSDLDALYISIGPGSFTGLRIAVTFAKTLTLATRTKLVAVPGALVLAENAPPDAMNLILVLDAKRDQIFTSRFRREQGTLKLVEPPHLDALSAMLERAPRPVHLLGEGIPHHQKFLEGIGGVIVTDPETWRPRAAVVARLGHAMARRGEFIDPLHLVPLYIRKPEAEEKWERERNSL